MNSTSQVLDSRVADALEFVASRNRSALAAPQVVEAPSSASASSAHVSTVPAVVQSALAFAKAERDRQSAAALSASRKAYAEGVAKVSLLHRAGRLLDAQELFASLVRPPLPPPTGAVAPSVALDDWRSLLEASSYGCGANETATTSPVHVIVRGWSAGLIDGARTTWIRIKRFALASGRLPRGADQYIYGYVVRDFLDEVDRSARRAYARRGNVRVDDAQGSTARQGAARNLKFLASNLSFPLDMASKSGQLAVTQSRRRSQPKSAPPLGVRMLCVLSWLTQHGASPFVRGHAAAWLATAMFAMRFANAQRSRLLAVDGDVVSAVCDLDAKASSGARNGRPMWTSKYDPLGSDAWITELLAMRDALPRAVSLDPHYFLRETNSPDGDPS